MLILLSFEDSALIFDRLKNVENIDFPFRQNQGQIKWSIRKFFRFKKFYVSVKAEAMTFWH